MTASSPLPYQGRGRGLGQASASAPGTCGELLQGILGGRHFHVTCPIDLYSTATVALYKGTGLAHGPADSPKAVEAARLTLAHFGQRGLDAHAALESPLPRGKGMASSTADVAATIAATAIALGRPLPPEQIACLALRVEPSDGLMFPGVVAFDHRHGRLYEPLGPAVPLRIVVLVFKGTVDTVAFNRSDRGPELAKRESTWRAALDLVREGLRQGDIRLIGRGVTMDTLAHEGLPLDAIRQAVLTLAKETGAVGVNTAHSGTVFGLLLPDNEALARETETLARSFLTDLEAVYICRLVDGGIRAGYGAARRT